MGPYYLTALVQLFGPVETVSGFGRRAQDKRTIGSGPRAGETFDVSVDTQISALLEFASGPIATARFSFDEPIATRELEVHGTGGAICLPDPNAFDGSVFVCKKDTNKSTPNEWLNAPTEADWTEFPAEGSAEGRGMGALDLARAARIGGAPRASADLALHVLDIMESILRSASSRQSVSVATTCKLADPLPATWDPLQKSTE
jgi:predicted dehydrogenase